MAQDCMELPEIPQPQTDWGTWYGSELPCTSEVTTHGGIEICVLLLLLLLLWRLLASFGTMRSSGTSHSDDDDDVICAYVQWRASRRCKTACVWLRSAAMEVTRGSCCSWRWRQAYSSAQSSSNRFSWAFARSCRHDTYRPWFFRSRISRFVSLSFCE